MASMTRSIIQKFQKLRANLNLERILGLIWSVSRKWTLVSLVFIFLETVCFFASLYVLKVLIDAVSGKASAGDGGGDVFFYVVLAGVTGVLYLLIRAVSAYLTEIQAAHVSESLNDRIHERTVSLDLAYYEDAAYFDTLKRALDAGTQRPSQVIVSVFNILKNVMTLLALGSVLLTINWLLLPLLVVFVLPILAIRIKFSDIYNEWHIRKTPLERKSDYLSNLITTEQAAKEIRSFNLGDYFKRAYLSIRMQMLDERILLGKKRTVNEIITTGLAAIAFFFCIGYIVLGRGGEGGSAGNIALFLIVFPQTFNVLQTIASGISTLYQNNVFINSIFDLLDLRPTMTEPASPVAIRDNQPFTLEVNAVDFTYPRSPFRSLDGVSLKLEPGKMIALVGENGSGKSSLVKLLCRLYDPGEGSVLLNGTDIRRLGSHAYRDRIGVVFQDFVRYQAPVSENIGYGNIARPRSAKEVRRAAVLAGADEFIGRLPEGYESVLGKLFEDGREPSLGQWQKLAIARALYKQPRLLIFDEATSSLDAIAEQQLLQTVRRHLNSQAVLMVSHRYAVTRHADYIYVLSGGRVVEEGTNEALISGHGEYARLFRQQINTETLLT